MKLRITNTRPFTIYLSYWYGGSGRDLYLEMGSQIEVDADKVSPSIQQALDRGFVDVTVVPELEPQVNQLAPTPVVDAAPRKPSKAEKPKSGKISQVQSDFDDLE